MENKQPKNITRPDNEKDIDEQLLMRVRSAERRLLKNIKWISVAIAALYLLGYIWRVIYYGRLRIPESFLDFPFPEILIPKSFGVPIFLAWLISTFSYEKFYQWIVKTNQVRFVKSSTLFYKIMLVILIISTGCLLYTKQYSLIAFAVFGFFLGKAVFKISSQSNRVQFWHLIWICFIIVIAVQLTDAWISAGRDMKMDKFPWVTLSSTNKENTSGMLLGFFKGKYFIMFLDEHDFPKLRILNAEQVEKVDLNYRSWTVNRLRKLKEDFLKLDKQYDELIKVREALRKESGDPNLFDDIDIRKPVWPFKDV